MKYKDALLVENKVEVPVVEDKWVSLEEAQEHIQRMREKPSFSTRSKLTDGVYEVMCENDHILYDVVKDIKELYEFKGFMSNPDLQDMICIFMKHMRIEEWEPADEDEDGLGEDEEL